MPDERLDQLAQMYSPEKYTPAAIEFVDIAGLVKGASKGEGLGNKFLSHIREVDAIIHVVRCFEDDDIIHVDGQIGPMRDLETINTELILSDIEIVERRAERLRKLMKGDKTLAAELSLCERIFKALNEGVSARALDYTDEERLLLADMPLLSMKPVIYAANISEDDIGKDMSGNASYAALQQYAAAEGAGLLPICASIESEIAQLPAEEKAEFLEGLGIAESGLNKLIKESYSLLGLISYLTAGHQRGQSLDH